MSDKLSLKRKFSLVYARLSSKQRCDPLTYCPGEQRFPPHKGGGAHRSLHATEARLKRILVLKSCTERCFNSPLRNFTKVASQWRLRPSACASPSMRKKRKKGKSALPRITQRSSCSAALDSNKKKKSLQSQQDVTTIHTTGGCSTFAP